ncbi:MAG: hypothetical protein IPO66_18245 [Rhodanobacteraceae bacterium]|nr:hypothetical protein [Rhodanobacteraceae bacterium]
MVVAVIAVLSGALLLSARGRQRSPDRRRSGACIKCCNCCATKRWSKVASLVSVTAPRPIRVRTDAAGLADGQARWADATARSGQGSETGRFPGRRSVAAYLAGKATTAVRTHRRYR